MYYEIRHYQARPGRRAEWVRYMEDVVIPFQASLGMDVTASFVDAEHEDGYVWMRRFDRRCPKGRRAPVCPHGTHGRASPPRGAAKPVAQAGELAAGTSMPCAATTSALPSAKR
ncbi:NIPSNAP family protein [Amycolatopsis sp. NPDC059235]|uniref:NIPSNAP family protein n=1 Tax=Amycolatopsis sp. NPDC059235 TaxID=3346782 RepID=UPI00366DCD69